MGIKALTKVNENRSGLDMQARKSPKGRKMAQGGGGGQSIGTEQLGVEENIDAPKIQFHMVLIRAVLYHIVHDVPGQFLLKIRICNLHDIWNIVGTLPSHTCNKNKHGGRRSSSPR